MQGREEVIRLLHKDIWSEELLGEEFLYIVERVLEPRERIVLENKVEGYPDEEICRLMRIKPSRLSRIESEIKSKFRNQIDLRVDNLNLKFIYSSKSSRRNGQPRT